ncbi:MAG: histidine kinase, partial [Leptolyngbya sp. SIO4C5]|nr:histidine kinase [Leptolyngbya sp. SIO4C5]
SSYVPVTFVEPWQTNEAALGYDLASDPTRRQALRQARDTGAIAISGRIQLVQETAGNQYSFLVFVPIYRQAAATVTTRQQQLQGYILGVFRVADVVEEALADFDSEIDFYIFDQAARAEEQLLGFYEAQTQQVKPQNGATQLSAIAGCPLRSDCTQQIILGQRQWQIVFLPTRPHAPLWSTLATLLIGSLMTITLLIYLSRWQSELKQTRELSQLKLRLFSMASHELRTPLSVIAISAQSLMANQGSLTWQQRQNIIARIQLAAKRMGQLVSDILTLTRAEAGKLEFAPEIVELAPFCQQLLEQVQLKPGQTLTLQGVNPQQRVYLDKNLMHSILSNLLANAAKYSPPNSPIELTVKEEAETLQFQVSDRGIGIPAATRPQIFEAFYRGQNVGTVPGTGLGLAVVQTCTDLHGGHLTVQSQVNEGTCIAVILPRME